MYFLLAFCNTLATWFEELTHLKRPWCWERLKAGGEGDDRGWDGWMASQTQWMWVSVTSGSWWWTGRPGVLQFMGSQRVGHDWVTEMNCSCEICFFENAANGSEISWSLSWEKGPREWVHSVGETSIVFFLESPDVTGHVLVVDGGLHFTM